MIKEIETEETIGFFVTFLSMVAFQLLAQAPWPPLATLMASRFLYVLLQLIVFMTIQKSLEANFRGDYYLLLKYCKGNVPYFRLSGPNHVQNLTQKCKVLNVF